jgi:hypothetical protein
LDDLWGQFLGVPLLVVHGVAVPAVYRPTVEEVVFAYGEVKCSTILANDQDNRRSGIFGIYIDTNLADSGVVAVFIFW